MKFILIALFALTAFAAGETLDSNCHDICVAGELVVFSGTGYNQLTGNAEYGTWVRGVTSAGVQIEFVSGGSPVSGGIFTSQGTFTAGSYQACSVVARKNKPLTVLACASITVT